MERNAWRELLLSVEGYSDLAGRDQGDRHSKLTLLLFSHLLSRFLTG